MKKLFILLLLMSVNLHAQKVKFSGKITGEENQNLSNVQVKLLETGQNTISGEDGYFKIKLNPGKYTVSFSLVGYQTRILKFDITQDLFVQVNLLPESEELSTVIINAVKATGDMPVTQTNISKRKIEEENLAQDIPYLLESTPSVVATSDAGAGIGYTGIRIRGISSQQINVTLNGVPLNDPESHSVYWVDVPDFAGNTESVQIQRGVGTSGFGTGAFGASINLETDRVAKTAYAQLQSSVGSFNTFKNSIKASTGLLNDHFEFTGRYSLISSDGYIDRASSDLKSYYLSGTYQDDNNTLKAIVFGGHEITYQAWYGVDKETFETNPTFNYAGAIYDDNWNVIDYYDNQVDNYQQDHYQLHFKHDFGENLYVNLTGHYTYGRGYYEQYKQDEDFSDYGFTPYVLEGESIDQTDLIRRKWLDNDFYGIIASVNYETENSKIIAGVATNEYDGRHFGKILWTEKAINVGYRQEYYRNTGVKKTTSGFAKSIYKINDAFNLFTDIQFRNISYDLDGTLDWQYPYTVSDDLFFINPKIGVTYQNGQHYGYVSLAQTHREPNRDDYVNNPLEKPEAETLDDLEAGWKYHDERFNTEVNLYGMYYKNQLVLTGKIDNVGNPIRENVGESYRIGIETQIGYRLTKKVNFTGNISFSDNRNIDYIVEENGELVNYGNTHLTYSPGVVGSAALSFKPVQGFKIKLTGKYVGKQYMDNRNIEASVLDPYFVSNLLMSYQLKPQKTFKNIALRLKINNLLDTQYASNGYMWGDTPYYFPQAGINFLLGLQLDL